MNEISMTEPETASEANGAANAGVADSLLDGMMPEGFDWRGMVREYPLPAVLMAAAGGWMLGRQRGVLVLTALGTFAAGKLVESLNEFFGHEVL